MATEHVFSFLATAAGVSIPQAITTYIKENHLEHTVRRGDAVTTVDPVCRKANEGVFLWDGAKAVPLDTTLDPQGSVPREFVVTDTEFSPYHWDEVVKGSALFWLSRAIRERARFRTAVGEDGDLRVWADLLIGKTMWRAYVHRPEDYDVERADGLEPGSAAAFRIDLLNDRFYCAYEIEGDDGRYGDLKGAEKVFWLVGI